METSEIRLQLSNIFNSVFKCGNIEITDDLTAEKIEKWDSLTHLTMIAAVESHFGIRFKLRELTGMKNTGDLIELILEKKQAV
ncbi:MAG: acyl carrier protein [Sphingomonadales bacterium]|nr:acyl carrier protein [Sphingomonadales bacterium]